MSDPVGYGNRESDKAIREAVRLCEQGKCSVASMNWRIDLAMEMRRQENDG